MRVARGVHERGKPLQASPSGTRSTGASTTTRNSVPGCESEQGRNAADFTTRAGFSEPTFTHQGLAEKSRNGLAGCTTRQSVTPMGFGGSSSAQRKALDVEGVAQRLQVRRRMPKTETSKSNPRLARPSAIIGDHTKATVEMLRQARAGATAPFFSERSSQAGVSATSMLNDRLSWASCGGNLGSGASVGIEKMPRRGSRYWSPP
jgi:hypothetical protein